MRPSSSVSSQVQCELKSILPPGHLAAQATDAGRARVYAPGELISFFTKVEHTMKLSDSPEMSGRLKNISHLISLLVNT